MQVAQSIPSNSYMKGSSNDIIFKLYQILSTVKGNLEEYIRPYIYVWMKGVVLIAMHACVWSTTVLNKNVLHALVNYILVMALNNLMHKTRTVDAISRKQSAFLAGIFIIL